MSLKHIINAAQFDRNTISALIKHSKGLIQRKSNGTEMNNKILANMLNWLDWID